MHINRNTNSELKKKHCNIGPKSKKCTIDYNHFFSLSHRQLLGKSNENVIIYWHG